MHLGKRLLVKHDGQIQEGNVEQIFEEDLIIRLDNGETITRKFWEIRSINYGNPKKE